MSGLASADYVVFGVLALSALFAFTRGFVREVVSIATWVGAALIALFGFTKLRPLAHRFVHPDWLADIGTALGLFFLAFVAISLLSRPILTRIEASDLKGIDRLLGLFFGLVRGAILISLAYLMVSWLVPADEMPSWVKKARTLPYVEHGAAALRAIAPHATDAIRPGGAKGAAPGQEKGYKTDERQEMDRLLQTNQ